MSTKPARSFWTMDYETIVDCFVAVFKHYGTGERRVFIVHRLRNDWQAYLDFLESCVANHDWHFGFNNIAFDAQITEYCLANLRKLRKMTDADEISDLMARYAGYVIGKSNAGEFLDFSEFKFKIPCVDIFKLNHWDNQAKRASLKWIQYTMDWPNVEEMPHHHTEPVRTPRVLHEVVAYCLNDVDSTEAIFKYKNRKGQAQMEEQIALRAQLSKTYDTKLFSASETRISKEVFGHFLSEEMGLSKRDLRGMQTLRDEVQVGDIILPMIAFQTPEFRAVHTWFKNLVVDVRAGVEQAEKKAKGPKHRMTLKGVPTDYGLGGLHGCIKSGIYESKNGKVLMSADVTSFYPMLAIKNKWHPLHIPQAVFETTYQGFFDKRKEYPKGHFLNYLFKIVLNATYGLSKNVHSFLYDPEFTFRITINGQLQLSMLYEMLMTRIPGCQPIMQNTDGLEVLIDERYKELYYQICEQWCAMTMLSLEFVEYDKMIIGDVNNYIAVWTEDGKQKTKCKGRFEFEDLALHKNKSMLVIPKALYEYYLNGTEPEQYLASNRNFFDYCAGAKLTRGWHFEEVGTIAQIPAELDRLSLPQQRDYLRAHGWEQVWGDDNWVRASAENKEARNGIPTRQAFTQAVSTGSQVVRTKHQKLLRYYISTQGNKLLKCHQDGRSMQMESGKWLTTTANKYVEKPFDDYGIDYRYYLKAIRDEIMKIEAGAATVILGSKAAQLELF